MSEPSPVPAGAGSPADWSPAPAAPYPPPGRWDRLVARVPAWAGPLGVLGCLGGAAGFVLVTDPTDLPAGAPPSCLLKYLTGLDCPGCGGTRAFFYLLHADLGAAARHHLWFVAVVPVLLYAYLAWAWPAVTGRRLPEPRFGAAGWGVVLGGWLLFSIARNLPWAPFTWMYV